MGHVYLWCWQCEIHKVIGIQVTILPHDKSRTESDCLLILHSDVETSLGLRWHRDVIST